MARMISYADAVRLLGGTESRTVTALDAVTKGLMFGAAVTFPAVLGWLEARTEFVRLCRTIVQRVSDRRDDLGRPERLLAAHSVIVVTAFFEALEEQALPFDLRALELDREAQIGLARGAPVMAAERFVSAVLSASEILPRPRESQEAFERELRSYYESLARSLRNLIEGLQVRDRLANSEWNRLVRALHNELPQRAVDHYSDLLRALASDISEVAQWVNLREHRATRDEMRALERQPVEEQRASLHEAGSLHLDRPVIGPGDLPVGLRVPVLRDAYVAPPCRTGEVRADLTPGQEEFWSEIPIRDDIDAFIADHLATPAACEAPLLVLGQPGAGKSVLCRVYAARLSAAGHLSVLVRLRSVAAIASIQNQIEEAIRDATGRDATWTTLAQSAGGTRSVILLDGFDELLQATGVSQSDYLLKVAEFQRRERRFGRPVAVIVTSRTSVADRARIPPKTVLMRLEPFDQPRIESWLATWNDHNEPYFAQQALHPLTGSTVAHFPELAGLPLLLLMLALYDADANALQALAADDRALSRGELYERLLHRFVVREIEKHRPSQTVEELRRAIDEEFGRLSVAAFGMLNRGQQWIKTAELENDLIPFDPPESTASTTMRPSLPSADLLIGRFFFVHHAQATQHDGVFSTYEFLHSTFGEYLVARFTWQLLLDAAARYAASTLSFSAADHGPLYALLSFAALSVRLATVRFLSGFADNLDERRLFELSAILHRLFADADLAEPGPRFGSYRPRPLTKAQRYAAYTANLVLLRVITERSVLAGQLFPKAADPRYPWRSATLLWRAQLSIDEWDSLMACLSVERIWLDGDSPTAVNHPASLPGQRQVQTRRRREVRITLDEGSSTVEPPDGYWSWPQSTDLETFSNLHTMEYVRRRTIFHCGGNDDVMLQAILPLLDTDLAITVSTFMDRIDGHPSAAQVLMQAVLLPVQPATGEERRAIYLRCAEIACFDFPAWSDATQIAYAAMLVNALSVDHAVPGHVVEEVLRAILASPPFALSAVIDVMIRCCTAAAAREAEPRATQLVQLADDLATRQTALTQPAAPIP